MKQSVLFLFLSLILVLGLSSCGDKQTIIDIPEDSSPEYFPLEVGKFLIYAMDSIIYDVGNNGTLIDTVQFLLKEEVVDTFVDNAGRVNYRIERSERANEDLPWLIKDVWVALQTDNTAERVEENFRFVKMVFPLKEGITWDGNQFVDKDYIVSIEGETLELFKGWESEVLAVDEEAMINGMNFSAVTTISHADNENLIELRRLTERYARNVGLIHKEMQILDTQCIIECEGQDWATKAEKGFILKQTILDFN